MRTADLNDNVFNLYSLSLNMELSIPKCQCSFTLLIIACIVGDVTSRSLFTSIFEYLTKKKAKTV